VGISPGKVREFYVDDPSDFPLGNLPTIRYRDAREKRKNTVAGRSRLLIGNSANTSFRSTIKPSSSRTSRSARIEHRLVFGIVFAAREKRFVRHARRRDCVGS